MTSALSVLHVLHDRARQLLDPAHYDYFAGGAGDETALGENERAFRRLALLPRVLRGNDARDTAVTLLGDRAATPVIVSPTAFHRLAHPVGERATARATAAADTILIASMASTMPVAEITAAARDVRPDAAVWFQLYLQPDHAVTAELVHRAEKAGCTALVVTVDSPVFGRRERDERNGFLDLPPGLAAENMRDMPGPTPVPTPGPTPGSTRGSTRDIAMSAALTWQDVRRLREITALPVVLKGILHPADARIAVAEGADAVMVSNHGGRQLDAAPATIDALPGVVEAVAGRVPVLMDGGVRRGSDAAVALALGAAAVGVGRPVLWGLAAEGETGVRQVLDALGAELDHVLALCGARRPGELTRDQVVARGPADGAPCR
jgi:4-hydroxymandelate oxidase